MATESAKQTRIMAQDELESVLSKELGALGASLILIPRDRSDVSSLPFDWSKAKGYYTQYCAADNDCPDGEFPLDCKHFFQNCDTRELAKRDLHQWRLYSRRRISGGIQELRR
jgi:hypothetical protein